LKGWVWGEKIKQEGAVIPRPKKVQPKFLGRKGPGLSMTRSSSKYTSILLSHGPSKYSGRGKRTIWEEIKIAFAVSFTVNRSLHCRGKEGIVAK